MPMPQIRYAVLATAAMPTRAAAIARAVSRPLTVATAGMGARDGGGRWATGAAVARGGGGAGAGADGAARLGAPVGPPGGKVGNLMVGAAVGLGGRLMRTVSFLG